jgi:hypothetical protein
MIREIKEGKKKWKDYNLLLNGNKANLRRNGSEKMILPIEKWIKAVKVAHTSSGALNKHRNLSEIIERVESKYFIPKHKLIKIDRNSFSMIKKLNILIISNIWGWNLHKS